MAGEIRLRRGPVFALGMAAALVAEAAAEIPSAVPPAGRDGREFVPNAGYRRTATLLYKRRQTLQEGVGPMLVAPGTVLDIRGERTLPVICVRFRNTPREPFTTCQLEARLFGTPTPPGAPQPFEKTLTQYYKDMSNGRLTVTGKVMGWYAMAQDDTYYADGSNGLSGAPIGELLEEALRKAEEEGILKSIDTPASPKEQFFAQFDNDGADGRPNSGDDDGRVDTVVFVHPEVGGEADNGANGNIWSHSWHYNKLQGRPGPFVTKAIRLDKGGNPVLRPDGTPEHIVVDDYTIQPAFERALPGHPVPEMIAIGVFCHEYGHALGIPDLYDRTPGGAPDSQGLGRWCLMAAGNEGGDGVHPETPTPMSAWPKYFLGWANVVTLESEELLTLEPVSHQNTIYRIPVPSSADNLEYFLVELRDAGPHGSAPGKANWDEFLPTRRSPANGLAIWHIDEKVGSTPTNPLWPFAKPGQGQNDNASRPNTAGNGFAPKHALVAMIQADGRMDLEATGPASNRGDADDLWVDAEAFEDDRTYKKGSRGYDGKETGISLTNLKLDTPNVVVSLAAPGGPRGVAERPEAVARHLATQVEDPARDQKDVEELSSLAERLTTGESTPLEVRQLDLLRATPPSVIERTIPPELVPALIRASSEARTKTITADYPAESDLEREIRQLVQAHEMASVTVQFAPSAAPGLAPTSIERITGLDLPPINRGPADSLTDVVREQLRAISPRLGLQVKRDEKGRTADGPEGPFVFDQVVSVAGHDLPVFGKSTTLYADDSGTVRAVTNQVIDPERLTVVGEPGSLTADEARGICARSTHTPLELLNECEAREGIILENRDDLPSEAPRTGRVVWRFCIPAGDELAPYQAYVDEQTKRVTIE